MTFEKEWKELSDKEMQEALKPKKQIDEKVSLVVAIGCNGNAILVRHNGPPISDENQMTHIQMELEGLNDIEIMDSIQWEGEGLPEDYGVYSWEGTIYCQTSTDWESGLVDDWSLIATGSFKEVSLEELVK